MEQQIEAIVILFLDLARIYNGICTAQLYPGLH